MRIIALLNWYEEPTAWLAETVASVAKVCDHLIAVDGAYALFPGSLRKPSSGPEQIETIHRIGAGAGMGVTVHVPREPWWGNEIEKRDFMFRLGEQIASEGDWYLIIDADEVITSEPADLSARLEASPHDAAELTLWEREGQAQVAELVDVSSDYRSPLRRLFRVQPGLHIEQAHYVVTVGDRVLCGNTTVHDIEAAESIPELMLEHRRSHRTRGRLRLKDEYGNKRNQLGLEKVEAIA